MPQQRLPQQRVPAVSLPQLEYLVAVADAPTWAAAASDLGVSPSALSQGLAELERRLGLPVFERRGRRRLVAPTAEPVLEYARSVLATSTDLARWIDEVNAGRVGELRLGMIDVAAISYFPDALTRLRREDGADLALSVAPSRSLIDLAQADRLDLAVIVRPDVMPADLEATSLLTERLGVYGPPGSARSKPSDWGPWIGFPPTSITRRLVERELSARRLPYQVVAETNQPDVMIKMVELGLGWAVLPTAQVAEQDNVEPAASGLFLERELVAIRRRGAIDRPVVDDVLDQLVAAGQTLGVQRTR